MGSHSSDDFTALWAEHDLGEVVVSAKEVHDRVLELGRQITLRIIPHLPAWQLLRSRNQARTVAESKIRPRPLPENR